MGLIIALANSPWTFVSHRLKTRGLVSPSFITMLRTAQLIGIGYASSVGLATGPGTTHLPINSIEETSFIWNGSAWNG